MRTRHAAIAAAILAALLPVAPAHADWPTEGRLVLCVNQSSNGVGTTRIVEMPAGAAYTPRRQTSASGFYLVADRGPGGGLVFVGSEPRPGPTLAMRVRWFSPDLSPDPAAPDSGALVVDPGNNALHGIQRAALADGAGGIFLAWDGAAGPSSPWPCVESALSMARVPYPATLGVPPARATGALSLGGATPNPVRRALVLQFTLPDDRPARLELFDVGGRRVRAVGARGVGPHVQRFDDLADLAPGLYVARLTQGAASRSTRFVRVR